jgi:regulator of protease activity HflC (stomatin/prohibitin superfamily)
MLVLRGLLLVMGVWIAVAAVFVLGRGLWRLARGRRRRLEGAVGPFPAPRFRLGALLALVSLVPTLSARSLVLVPPGHAGVRVSQLSGTRPGTLATGLHLVKPLIEEVAIYDVRERVLTTDGDRGEALRAQTKEGLTVGLVVSVRYRLDPQRLDHVHANLPAVDEVVPPVVGSVFRQLVPGYVVREVFAAKRDDLRERAARIITDKLAADGVLVREVMLRDVVLPPEYSKGLEGLLLKEQQNERMVYDLQIKEKEVKQAELEAEAEKARRIKEAEAQASVRVLQAKAEADAMQHTLPLKEKQIEQTRLEAEARKESTIKAAEAAAQAKVIDSKAEVERSNLLAGAEAHRIRVTSAAESERMKLESDVLRENPLLIQKIVAERLSDKMQIMMVPTDGRNFFANEVFREAALPLLAPPRAEGERRTTEGERKTARR